VPAFRALLRAVEARFYQVVDLPGPVLDLGCGDGHFAQMTFDAPLDAGVDPWWNPLRKAAQTDRYRVLVQGMGDRMPFPDHHFGSAFSNSVLEHIPDVQAVLNETSRVLQPNGRFLITMPSHYFTQYLGGAELLQNVGLGGLAPRYRHFFNHPFAPRPHRAARLVGRAAGPGRLFRLSAGNIISPATRCGRWNGATCKGCPRPSCTP
jgi:SAM-dependent methyltransferase